MKEAVCNFDVNLHPLRWNIRMRNPLGIKRFRVCGRTWTLLIKHQTYVAVNFISKNSKGAWLFIVLLVDTYRGSETFQNLEDLFAKIRCQKTRQGEQLFSQASIKLIFLFPANNFLSICALNRNTQRGRITTEISFVLKLSLNNLYLQRLPDRKRNLKTHGWKC